MLKKCLEICTGTTYIGDVEINIVENTSKQFHFQLVREIYFNVYKGC